MIAYIKGKLAHMLDQSVIIDVSGVGYEVFVSTETLSSMPGEGKEVFLYCHHHFSEQDQRLFGFLKLSDKELYLKLITVKSVGPKLGLNIMSGLPADDLRSAIAGEDAAALSRIPGIGKKTAERIVLELRDKVSASVQSGGSQVSPDKRGLAREVSAALMALGYRRNDAEKAASKAIKDANGEAEETGALVKAALRLLQK